MIHPVISVVKLKHSTIFLFQCSVAKAVWAIIALSLGANNIPKSLEQAWVWCEKWLPLAKKYHTLGIAAVCWVIWKTRNKICFEGKTIHDPASIVCYACVLMSYWAGLYPDVDKEALEAGINTMLQIAMKLVKKKKTSNVQLLEDNSDNRDAT